MIAVSQPDGRWRGDAYDYLRESDDLPTYEQLPDVETTDLWVCKVKLFLTGSRWTYFAAAATWYGDYRIDPVLSGWVYSPLGPDMDEWGDSSLMEIMALRDPAFHTLPVERDLNFRPATVAEIKALAATGA